jgi:hypothetical protein
MADFGFLDVFRNYTKARNVMVRAIHELPLPLHFLF